MPPPKVLYTKQVSDWLGLPAEEIQASFAALGAQVKEIAIDLSNHAQTSVYSEHRDSPTDKISQISLYPACLESEQTLKGLSDDPAQWQHITKKWRAILSKHYHDLNILFDQFKPDVVVFVQGYAPINAIVRLLSIEKNIPFYALENTAISDRMLWDNQSGITVTRNLSKNFYWKFCDLIPDHESNQYCKSLIADTRCKKQGEHTSPSTPFPIGKTSDLKTVVFLGQVYTDASVLFNSAAWEDQVQVATHLARLAKKLNFKLIIKLHPKEATGSTPTINKPYNHLTHRKLMASDEFSHFLDENSDTFIDVHNEYDTYQMIESADTVVTLNSQSGLEAAIRGIPTVVCGQAFYGHLGFTFDANVPALLEPQLQSALELDEKGKVDLTRHAQKFAHIFFDKYCVPKTPCALAELVYQRGWRNLRYADLPNSFIRGRLLLLRNTFGQLLGIAP